MDATIHSITKAFLDLHFHLDYANPQNLHAAIDKEYNALFEELKDTEVASMRKEINEKYFDRILNHVCRYASANGFNLRKAMQSKPKPSPLMDLDAFAVLGLDVKITPNNQVRIIEINGMNSGMKGFTEAGVHMSLRDKITARFRNHELNSCKQALYRDLTSFGITENLYFTAQLEAVGFINHHMWGPSIPWGHSFEKAWNAFNPEWHETYFDKGCTLVDIEEALSDKFITNLCFAEIENIKEQQYGCNITGLTQLLRENDVQHVVAKHRLGVIGDEINIYDSKDAHNLISMHDEIDYILEPFVESKPIYCKKTGKKHDGCMRYVVLAQIQENDVKLNHYKGYWRLCPEPLSHTGSESKIANLGRGAYAQQVSRKDLQRVKNAVDATIPQFLRNVLSLQKQRSDYDNGVR